jgi:hypothetical protein
MAIISGSVQLNQLNDADMAKVFEFKAAHEGKFNFDFHTPQPGQYNPAPGVNNVTIGWSTIEGLDLTSELVKELLPKADAATR